MRLNSLDLTRYGKFTELSLSFGTAKKGSPDLHVIYGANEAGKSTLLSGWLDLLFQIPMRSPMDFLHPYTSMQIGAALDIDTRLHDVVRVKKRDHSLLDAQGTPIGEALLQGGLRGLDRASYSAMFSLNRQTLDEGGESILASEGDLGELLFQASAGLTDLTAQLDTIREESIEFLNATGRKGRLRELRAEFDRLGEQMKALDTAAAEYTRLAKERDTAQAAWQNARTKSESAQTKVIETERLSGALPLALRLTLFETKIAKFGDLADPPEGWFAELPGLDREETEMATRLESAQNSVTSHEEELDKIPQDTEIIDASNEIAATELLKSAYDTALTDVPKRLKERDAENDSVRDSLVRLGQSRADPATVLPEVAVLGRLRGLIEQHSGIETKYVSAAEELERARADADRAAQRLQRAGGSAADLGGLGGLVQNIRRDDPAGSLDRAQALHVEAETNWQEKLSLLVPWCGDAVAVECLPRPDRLALERLAEDIENTARKAERESETLERLEEDAAQHAARQEKAGATSAITLKEAANIRTQREAEWVHHRANLNAKTADRFEAAMRLDDQVAATVSDQRARAERALEAERALAEAQRLVDAAKIRVKNAATQQSELAATLTGIVSDVSPLLPADMGIARFRAWLEKLEDARDALRKRNETARRVSHGENTVDRTHADLLAALSLAGREIPGKTNLALALETAQSLLDRATQIGALGEAEANAQQEMARRAKAMTGATAGKAAWQSEWEAACAETWMADTPPNVPEMRAVLNELDLLRRHYDRAIDLNRRIAAMQTNTDQFEHAVNKLKSCLGLKMTSAPHDLWRDIIQRLKNAETSQRQRAELTQRLILARQSLTQVQQKVAIHRSRTAEFAHFFGVTTWQQTREALNRANDRAELTKDSRLCAEDLCTQMRTGTIKDALERLQGVDGAELEARAQSLRSDLKTLRSNQEEAHTGFRQAEDDLEKVGGDGAVAQLEEQRQTLLLEMEDGAKQHLQRRLGLLAIDAALRQYRDTHRSGMLERASDAFCAMSVGHYSGLAAQPDGTREILVALAAEGGSREAAQLSDGTRAQLYLALRIAGYHEFVRNNGPVPFVADDIMESFDDDRSAETLKLLAKMSETGQVIYLTHHAHVCEIAKQACPSVRIHQLPA